MANYKNCKTFIGYRRKENRPMFAPSEDVAGLIWWWINKCKNPEFSPAFFQETYSDKDVTYVLDGIEGYMPYMKKAFFVLCPQFFNFILDFYYEIRDDYASAEEAAAATIKKLEKDKTTNICYFEWKAALARWKNHDIDIHPIIVKYNGEAAGYNAYQLKVLSLIFGEEFKQLFTTVNSLTFFEYDEIKESFDDFHWQGKTMDDVETQKFIEELEEIENVKKFKDSVLMQLQHPTKTEYSAINEKDIKRHLKQCTTTIIRTQQPKAPDDDNFQANNPAIIYDPVAIRDAIPKPTPPFLAYCMLEAFKMNGEKFGFTRENNYFGYWNVDVDPDQIKPDYDGISVCAVCFGSLILQHRLKKDSLIIEDSEQNVGSIRERIKKSINLLIALRNPYTKTWPSLWVFNSNQVDSEGTVNQTTLSLSTLLSCDFLSPSVEAKISDESLKERFKFIWESTEQLLNGCRDLADSDHENAIGWGYKINSKKSEPACLAFTCFVFDTLFKLKGSILKLKESFKEQDDQFVQMLNRNMAIIDRYLQWTFNYFESAQDKTTGAFKRTGEPNEKPSITHTAYVIKSLLPYIASLAEKTSTATSNKNDSPENNLVNKAIKYLIDRVEAMKKKDSFDFADYERFEIDKEKTNAVDPNGMDQYEHSAELIVAETLIKTAEQNGEYSSRALECLEWILNKYLHEDGRIVERNGTVILKGEQAALPYPIFYLYYFRMVLMDYLLLKKGN